ncbi:hypothetical protein AM501_05920 [Aneurinibacillus migulanus]|uniref:YhcN/YlaJ family sporulation lipoprotein n=1 Tax=Aneurinibacillus migulanus TaxID=47500 RepID=UPI0005B77643|nr:YhcN/YlaJ family sporulation lipoprotein [Aneurinibacillus migulanus]KIV54154.1 hypothetical protein TS64_13545 [Aneurinibacillus migulanus]KPD09155.1 hypothetical protein AM501_05920 [Aneurinibacillus migulanus]CEH29682.1 Sporulation lipoprotein YhcN/YlaJ [Aneurinibacillus migulanus]
MHKTVKSFVAASLVLTMTSVLAACGPRAGTDNGTNTQSGTYRLNQYNTNGTTMDDNFGIRPYGTQQYGLRPDMAHTYPHPNMIPGRYNTYGVHPYALGQQDQKVAERVAQLAANVNGVTRATAVVDGRDAVIGIEGATASNMKTLERNVYEAVKRAEPGYTVHVTSNQALTQRIRTLNSRMTGAGTRTLQTDGEDIRTLIRDIGRSVTAPFR